ncbi:hypothetical protein N7481_010084 [Penicillium waksmanii]|uniref:uncharacterized protein n=1 Tax=Penicillium waksmanii TaxID=69791 RepID=UPI0025469F4A|nr:uncharacterized protein N7481_010084 [Penicillium waksmanii]KAJ5976377.1 hypothetical protein N7481_010084 [Penicillium waksmanii]
MDDESGDTELPPDNPTNMPGHIIKATQYIKVFPDIEDLLFVCSWLGGFTSKWFRKLAMDKNPLTPTWQHLDDSEIPVYRLSDHVWIWKAFKGIEELIKHVENTQSKMPHETLKEFLRITSHLPHRGVRKSSDDFILDFTAEEIRRQNLRRFTIENDILKKRMLSVTRNARETRFLLHSRDTVLYYGLDWGFFTGEDVVWKQLIEAQTQHDEASNDESQWDNPLRYGLAIEMAKEGHRLERTFAPVEMFDHAKDIILKSSSENGLFPGQLDDFSKEPALFDRELFRDFYFHVGFELPYILLRTIEEPGQQTSETPGQRRPRLETPQSPVQRARELSPMPEPVVGTVPGYINTQDGRAFAIQRTLKRQNPYGRLVDLSNIVEVPEEWIYRQQDFLTFIPPADKLTLDLLQSEAPGDMKKAMEKYLFSNAVDPKDTTFPSHGNCYVSINDVRKDRKQRKWSVKEKSAIYPLLTYKDLWFRLQKRRNAAYSKKRLIYLKSPDYIVASLCYVASPESERGHIAQFFDRHAKVHANWLYDDTAAVFNSWITEVHFRFFQVFSPNDGEIPSQEPTPVRQLKSQTCGISGDHAYLVDAVISFRISGDFFDRYWTCYVAQHFANPKDLESPLTNDVLDNTTHWQQRKVLELMLMNCIVEKVYTSTSSILRRIEQGPRQKTSDAGEKYFSKDSFEDRKPGELRECFQLLVILKNNITSLQGLIEQWNNRESSQGRERPRWTRSDEQKYRKSIKQKTAQFEDHNREIKAAAARIEFLIALVTNAQDAIRAKKSLREAENITLFTYVTVFFLPVGLAVSVFGMNGIPGRTTIVSMLVTAAVALLITIGVLWCVLSHLISFGFRSPWSLLKTRNSRQRPVEVGKEGLQEENPSQRIRRRLSHAYNVSSKPIKYDRDLESQTELTREERLSTLDERSFK